MNTSVYFLKTIESLIVRGISVTFDQSFEAYDAFCIRLRKIVNGTIKECGIRVDRDMINNEDLIYYISELLKETAIQLKEY